MTESRQSNMQAQIQIQWDAMVWALGFMDTVPDAPGTYRARLSRQQGDYHPAERLELVMTVGHSPLNVTERAELERLRALVGESSE